MNIFSKLGTLILGFAEDDALPWFKNLFHEVEHDVVTNVLPDIEAALASAGVTAVKDLTAGDTFANTLKDAGDALASVAPSILAKAETVTLQDVFTAAAAAAANASVAAKAAAAATPAP